MGKSEKGCEWQLGVIFNKIEISNPKISLIYFINNPPNPNCNNVSAIKYSGANIHLEKQSTPTMAPVIMENDMKSWIPDGSTIESTCIATLHLPGLIKKAM